MDINDIQVVRKVKVRKHGTPLIGYMITLYKYSKHDIYINKDTMEYLANDNYIRVHRNKEKIVSFPDFKDIHSEYMEVVELNGISTSKESLYKMIQLYGIKQQTKNDKSTIHKESNANIDRINKEELNKAKFKTANCIDNSSKNAYVIGIIHSKDSGKPVCGYVIYYSGVEYRVSKEYGLKLAKEYKLENAKYYHNRVSELIYVDGGNRLVPRIYDDGRELISDSLELNSAELIIKSQVSKIVGCIFNKVGIIIGVKVKIAEGLYSIRATKFNDASKKYNILKYIVLTYKQAETYKDNYAVSITRCRGQEIYRKLNIISPHITPDMSIDIFGKEQTYIVDDKVDYGDLELRKKVLRDAAILESNLLTGRSKLRIKKSDIKLIASVMTDNIVRQSPIISSKYVIEYNNSYYVVDYSVIMDMDEEIKILNNFITLWVGELKHSFYIDAGYILPRLSNINKTAKEGIIEAGE